jgi:hypothetical protein
MTTLLTLEVEKFELKVEDSPLEYMYFKGGQPALNQELAEASKQLELELVEKGGWVTVEWPNDPEFSQKWVRKSARRNTPNLQLESWGPKFALIRSPMKEIPFKATNNLLVRNERLIGIVDPTVYEDPEIEPRPPPPKDHSSDHRNPNPIPHIGCWSQRAGEEGTRITKDTKDQPDPRTIDNTELFLRTMQKEVAPILRRFLKERDPLVYQFQMLYVPSDSEPFFSH